MKKVDLATTTSITTTYAGEFAGEYISAALLSAPTIENGGISVKPNIKYKDTIKVLSTDDIVKDGTCDFTATSTITTTERQITPEEFQVNLELCKKDHRSDWEAMQMGISVYDNLPPKFSDHLLGYVASKVASKNETNIWHGVNANAGEYDGLVVLATADATVVDVVGTTVTAANVITELGKVADAIPNTIRFDADGDLKLYVAQNVAAAYIRALGGFGASGLGAAGTNDQGTQWYTNGSLSFDGIPIFVANGLSDNYMVAAKSSNLWFGTGLLNDMQEVKVLDMADLDGSQNVRVIMRFTASVQYGIGSEIVLYTPV